MAVLPNIGWQSAHERMKREESVTFCSLCEAIYGCWGLSGVGMSRALKGGDMEGCRGRGACFMLWGRQLRGISFLGPMICLRPATSSCFHDIFL